MLPLRHEMIRESDYVKLGYSSNQVFKFNDDIKARLLVSIFNMFCCVRI